MTDVSGVSNKAAVFESISGTQQKKEEPKKNELGQSAFLELMITQLKNQNPLDPQDNSAFVAQLAQFSSVEGLEKLNVSMSSMSNSYKSSSALQASALVGRAVMVEASEVPLNTGGVVLGQIALKDNTSNLIVNIFDQNGALVNQQSLGKQNKGELDFQWDGKDSNGKTLPAGMYKFEALAEVNGKQVAQKTQLSTNVNSVTLGNAGQMTLNLNGVGAVKLSDIREIM